MNPKLFVLLACAAAAALGCVCAAETNAPLEQHVGESVVCIGEEPAVLAYLPDPAQPVRIRNTYLPSAGTTEYAEGRDYTVD